MLDLDTDSTKNRRYFGFVKFSYILGEKKGLIFFMLVRLLGLLPIEKCYKNSSIS